MSEPAPVGGVIILAAGRSRRFGADKRAHKLADGRTLLNHSIERYGAAFAQCRVIVRPDDAIPGHVTSDQQATDAGGQPAGPGFIRADDADLGMGHSLAAGVRSVEDWDYVFVALADMPWVQAATLAALRAAMEQRCRARATIIQPVYAGRVGHPVGFSRDFFAALADLRGDAGARAVLQANASAIVRLAFEDPGILQDLDTPDAPGAR